ncbi:pre-rRNA-processing protein esf1 [Tulasnella sp. UAMH 9824]|nr:pre-rRNA-processing protein esf1 [Tulasnella sp. UAMH 9824]
MSDPRFARIKTDPRFKRPRKDQHKVVVDERFKSIFENGKGKGKNRAGTRIDKYGRRVSATKERDDIRKFYRLEEDDQPEAGPSEPEKTLPKRPDYARGEVMMESSDEGEEEEADSAEEGPVELGPASYQLRRKAKATKHDEDVPSDLEINLDETEFADLDAEAAAYSSNASRMGFGEQKRTTRKGQETRRIAVVNLDWDHVKAAHLFKVFNSCATMMEDAVEEEAATGNTKRRKKKTALPAGRSNRILRVTVYPSEFGKERMAKEDVEGPPVEIYADPKKKNNGKNILTDRRIALRDDDEDLADVNIEDINEKTIYHQEDADQYDQDALRQYQLERLRYYYAIVECDTPETAAYVYKELDATELERTANLLDLSFVPDSMDFDGEFRDEATQDLGNLKPLKFETDALRSSKVKLTWDDDDADRVELTRRPLTAEEIEANDFKAYLANTSDSSEEDEGQAPKINGKAGPEKKKSLKERKQAERDRLRSLLLGGGSGEGGDGDDFFVNPDLPEGWGDGAGKNKAAEMEITFTPGLSAKKDGQESDEENLTTLERYKKKMKEQKLARMSKLEKQRRKNNGEDDPKERDKTSAKRGDGIGKDGFFEQEDGQDEDRSDTDVGPGKSRRPSTKEELALLAADIANDDGGKRHFDMAKVIKAEKMSAKKKQPKFKKKGQHDEEAGNEDEAEDGRHFEIDVKDKRFQALHDEYEFAIDPSNPHFKKTKAMGQLLDERRKRLKEKVKAEAEERFENRAARKESVGGGNGDLDLQKLIQSVKRKTGAKDGPHSELRKEKKKKFKPS